MAKIDGNGRLNNTIRIVFGATSFAHEIYFRTVQLEMKAGKSRRKIIQ